MNPQQLYLPVISDPEYHYEAINVENQQRNPHSLLHWTKRLIALARSHKAFGRGRIDFLHPDNRKVLAFLRTWEDDRILVVANLSRFVEHVELDLSEFAGEVPVELFSGRPFPGIGELPYLLTLGPHGFLWFRIERHHPDAVATWTPTAEDVPRIAVNGTWSTLVTGDARERLEAALPALLKQARWFGGKGRPIGRVRIQDALPIRSRGTLHGHLVLVAVEQGGDSGLYTMPMAFAEGERAEALRHQRGAAIADLEGVEGSADGRGLLYDASADEGFGGALLELIRRGRSVQGRAGALVPSRTRALRSVLPGDDAPTPRLRGAEQTNTSLVYGDRAVLKLFRHPGEGVNPDLEIGRHLTEKTGFAHVPATLGALEYGGSRETPRSLAILQAFVENEGDAWSLTLDHVQEYFEEALAEGGPAPEGAAPAWIDGEAPSAQTVEALGIYPELARRLGERTASLHLALAEDTTDPEFAPEPFGTLYQRSRYQSMRNTAARSLDQLRRRQAELTGEAPEHARRLLAEEGRIDRIFHAIVGARLGGLRTRIHGDYHLGQILYTGPDFVILDFEGEPVRPIAERRLKRSPLVDVAGLLRSFDYASWYWLVKASSEGTVRVEDVPRLEPFARLWSRTVSRLFLDAYRPAVSAAGLLPDTQGDTIRLLDALALEKCLYELGYELGHRPDWVGVPLRGAIDLLGIGTEAS